MGLRSTARTIITGIALALVAPAVMSCRNAASEEEAEVIEFHPGDVVPDEYIAENGADTFFWVQSIPDTIFALMQGRTYKAGCTIPREDLRYLTCLHKDSSGRSIMGEMVLNKEIADDVLEIFRALYEASYPIERMRLPDYWEADDAAQMRDNNSSSFNFRLISGTGKVSKHGMGMAIDVNPLYNPHYRRITTNEIIEPAEGKQYVDRSKDFPYKIEKGDLCYNLFISKGFVWGGNWRFSKDYQHFEKL